MTLEEAIRTITKAEDRAKALALTSSCAMCGFPRTQSEAPCVRCGAHSASQPDVAVSPFIVDRRYRLEAELGEGGMGIVYRARDTFLDRAVALKLILPKLAANERLLEIFRSEAKSLARIRHENVVQVYSFGPHADTYFLALEYVQGHTLRALLEEHERQQTPMLVHLVMTILEQVLDGLTAVHAAGIVHRDVKPENVVIENDTGRAVLLDFGIAAPEDVDFGTPLFAGSPGYMAPEQINRPRNQPAFTTRSDIYALGCTAFELLTGQRPFVHKSSDEVMRRHLQEEPPPVSSLRPSLEPFDGVIARALAKDSQRRFETCEQLRFALRDAWERYDAARNPEMAQHRRTTTAGALQVLVIDGDPSTRKLATQVAQIIFFQKDIRVKAVSSGAEALARAELRPPDLVLLGHDTPGLDGLEILSRLRSLPKCSGAKVVVLGGEARSRWQYSVLGVRTFVDKPVVFRVLAKTLEGLADRFGWNALISQRC